ncbi:MAG: C25 family cysteine peptidase [Pseudomonadota bacterium]
MKCLRTSRFYDPKVLLLLLLAGFALPAYSQSSLDWDVAVFPTGGNDINYGVGTANLNISHTGAQPGGRPVEAGTYAGSGGFGTGNSVIYGSTAGSTTTTVLTFSPAVSNLQVSVYDIDNSDSVTVSAFNGAADISGTVALAPVSGTPTFTLTGNTGTGTGVNSGGGSTAGTLNVTVPGPVTELRFAGSAPGGTSFLFAVSDVTATPPAPPAIACSAALNRLDWDTQAYPGGSLTPAFNVADVAPFPDVVFTFSHSGNTADLGLGAPAEDGGFTGTGSIGGGGNFVNYFHDPDPDTNPQQIISQIDFSDTLQDVRFSIADIDSNVEAEDFADQATVIGLLPGGGTTAPVYEAVSSGPTYGFVGGAVNSHETFDDGTNNDPRSAVNIYFDQPIVGIRMIYDDLGPNTWDSSRAILLSDILYCPPSSVPVTLSFLKSTISDGATKVSWQTASQSLHAGFELQLLDAGRKAKTDLTVPTNKQWSTEVESYSATLPGTGREIRLISHDINGARQVFGPFEVGQSYGARLKPNPVPWAQIRAEMEATAALVRQKGTSQRAQVSVSQTGIQRVTFDDLLAAGVDLSGASAAALAVTFRGAAVARRVELGNEPAGFGSGDFVDFFGRAPAGADALYLTSNSYQIELNPALVTAASVQAGAGRGPVAPSYRHTERAGENNAYQPATPTLDPWFDREISTFGPASVDLTLPVSAVDAGTATVQLDLVALTDFMTSPDPDHHLVATLNGGAPIIDAFTDGLTEWVLTADVPATSLLDGDNVISATLPGDTGFPFDIVNLEAYAISYPRQFVAIDDRLAFDGDANAFALTGFSTADLVAYAVPERGGLVQLTGQVTDTGTDFSLAFGGVGSDSDTLFQSSFESGEPLDPTPAEAAFYEVSSVAGLARPDVAPAPSPAPPDVDPETNFVLLTHPAFLGAELDRYVAARRAQGFRPQVFNLDTVYAGYGSGMPLPAAITAFLEDVTGRAPVAHVLLVGADSYDYRDDLGAGSVSFIPTRYAGTNPFVNYTPSDALLADFNADEVSDVAIGRWPVRTLAELTTLIDKTLAFDASGLAAAQKLLLAAGANDDGIPPFFEQARRIGDRVVDGAGSPWADRQEAFVELDGLAAAQQALLDGINSGQTLTVYSGHGAADLWAFEGLLTPALANTLTNAGEPTLLMPLTCYTTYFVDPSSDTLAYALLNGGDRGAVAVHGAATLSVFGDNEVMGQRIVDDMLQNGVTLGEAINAARAALASENFNRYRPVIINWALLGDPTLRITP